MTQLEPSQQANFDRVIDEARVKMMEILHQAGSQVHPAFAPSVALEIAKAGVQTAALALVQMCGRDMTDEALLRQTGMDVCTFIKICARTEEGKQPPIGAYAFIERLRKRGMQ